eukprot:2840402-Amphidinium_carterae.1
MAIGDLGWKRFKHWTSCHTHCRLNNQRNQCQAPCVSQGKSQSTREEVMLHPEENVQAEPQNHSATTVPSRMTAAKQQHYV